MISKEPEEVKKKAGDTEAPVQHGTRPSRQTPTESLRAISQRFRARYGDRRSCSKLPREGRVRDLRFGALRGGGGALPLSYRRDHRQGHSGGGPTKRDAPWPDGPPASIREPSGSIASPFWLRL